VKKKLYTFVAAVITFVMLLAGGAAYAANHQPAATVTPNAYTTTASQFCALPQAVRVNDTTWSPNQLTVVEMLNVNGTQIAPTTATAVQVNVTYLGATGNTYLTFWPAAGRMPTYSDVPATNQVTANAGAPTETTTFSVGVGYTDTPPTPDGSGLIAGYNHTGSVRVIFDVSGYYVATGATC
jgi:hypothetical protein